MRDDHEKMGAKLTRTVMERKCIKMKTITKYVVMGAAMQVGCDLVRFMNRIVNDKYERARIKQKCKNIKNELLNKD